MKRLLIVVLICGSAVFLASAQSGSQNVSKSGTTAATFLEIGVGAQAVGMGGAYVSVANNSTALHWNPAGVASLSEMTIDVVHTTWIADTKFDFAGAVLPLGSAGTLGFSLTALSMGDMKVRTVEQPEGTGEYFSAGDLAAGISYARQLTERFAIGFTAKYIQQTIWHESASAFAVDLGTTFKTDLLGGMTIGASLSNFGTSMKMSGRDTRQFVRLDPSKQGSSDQIPTNIELDSWDLPLFFQFGVSTRVFDNNQYRWTIAVDALHPNDNYESLNIGTEFVYSDYLFLRAGYQSLFLDQAEGGMSFGLGLTSGDVLGSIRVAIDYAYQDMGRLQGVHVLTLGLRF
ncbi:MAG: PorV/PorQ family protein [Ignavibacteriales bacterium]|nr:PorV/PorQ family protein [Ignavibacteriales bacterium]